ncbi:hypothetical protein KKF04_06505, partial [Patescibacteria group bacterium]|nr:hypothetical protein [Patescibacteria group bacterium]
MGLLSAEQVGLYINPDYIEIVIIEKQFKNIKIKNVFRKNISIQDMDVLDQNEIIKNSINDLFNTNKISKSNVFLNLPTQEVVLRTFTMPRLPKSDWANAIRFEGQKHVPFKIN